MKNVFIASVSMLLIASNAFAGTLDKMEAEACQQLLCLYGYEVHDITDKVECQEPLSKYSNIKKLSKWTKSLMCHATKELRFAQLLTCNQTDYSPSDIWKKLITCSDYD